MISYNKEGVGRFYSTPKGDFPSVTTVLGAYGDKTKLQEWRKRIGNEEADRIIKEATDIGSHLHYLFECLFRNEVPKNAKTKEEKNAVQMFNASKNKLMKIVEQSLFLEEPVWSETFRIAGRFDLLCRTKEDKIVLIDFKNTRRIKSKKDIDSYRQQLAFYAIMIKETLKIDVEEQKIFMVNREGFVQIFNFYEKDTPKSELIAIRKNFLEKYGY